MAIFAEMAWQPVAIAAWLAAGLLAGWLIGKVFGEGGYGFITDLVLGMLGALAGGFLFGVLKETGASAGGGPRFFDNLMVALLGACLLVGTGRLLGTGRRT